MAEHVEIINATGELRAAVHSGDASAFGAARAVVAGLLWPHTEAEEAGLFRVMAQDEVYAGHIATLCGEHETLGGLLAAIAPGDDAAMARFTDALRDHIDKEDNGPAVGGGPRDHAALPRRRRAARPRVRRRHRSSSPRMSGNTSSAAWVPKNRSRCP
jgi:hypothetical protein